MSIEKLGVAGPLKSSASIRFSGPYRSRTALLYSVFLVLGLTACQTVDIPAPKLAISPQSVSPAKSAPLTEENLFPCVKEASRLTIVVNTATRYLY
jgi:hypothetical protein